jgi:hypothetical protein
VPCESTGFLIFRGNSKEKHLIRGGEFPEKRKFHKTGTSFRAAAIDKGFGRRCSTRVFERLFSQQFAMTDGEIQRI